MDPITALAIAQGAVDIIQHVEPIIMDAVKKGQISPETQELLLKRIQALRLDAAFQGPEWIPS